MITIRPMGVGKEVADSLSIIRWWEGEIQRVFSERGSYSANWTRMGVTWRPLRNSFPNQIFPDCHFVTVPRCHGFG